MMDGLLYGAMHMTTVHISSQVAPLRPIRMGLRGRGASQRGGQDIVGRRARPGALEDGLSQLAGLLPQPSLAARAVV